MAKNKSSRQPFAVAVSEGMGIKNPTQNEPTSSNNQPVSKTNSDTKSPVNTERDTDTQSGLNPYYDYHPKTGKRGGAIGAPRATVKRTQISIGCTEEEKALYKKAASADGRKLSDFVYHAILEYIDNHDLSV